MKRKLPHPSRSTPGFNSEIDPYFDVVNKDTGAISFRKSHGLYKIMKTALHGIGIDVDAVKTKDELHALEDKHIEHIDHIATLIVLNKKTNSLNNQFLRALSFNDKEEISRLSQLLKKRDRLRLRVVE